MAQDYKLSCSIKIWGWSDGYNYFRSEKPDNKLILINSACGIKQSFYYKFATFLSKKGFDVITYDYRGIGLSKYQKLKGFNASMTDWAEKDFAAVTNYINANFANYKKTLIGHSFGGNSIGMASNVNSYDAYVTIASQFGYWKFFNPIYQPLLLWVFYIIMPFLSNAYGYFPSKVKQLGEKLPKGVAFDWITIITNSDSMLELTKRTGDYYDSISKPMLVMSFSDDQMAPKRAVDELSNRLYRNALVNRLHIKADKLKPIGHLNFFKKQFETDLWMIPFDWIESLEIK